MSSSTSRGRTARAASADAALVAASAIVNPSRSSIALGERTETVIVVHDEDLRTGCHRLSVTPCLGYRIRAGPDPEQGQPVDSSQAHPDVR